MRTTRAIWTPALAAALLALAAGPAAAIRAGGPSGARPQLDARSGERASVPASVHGARHALAERLGIEAHVSTDPVGGGVRAIDRTDGFLSGPHAGDPAAVALAWVTAHADAFGLSAGDVAALRLTEHTTSTDGVTHLAWVPQRGGVPAYDSALRVHVTRDGRVLAASGPPLGGLSLRTTAPRLTASQALGVAQNDVGAPAALPRGVTRPGAERTTSFGNGDGASLVAFEAPSGDRLAWRVTVAGKDPYWYEEVIDAATGELLARRSLTDFAVSNASVFEYHPGAAAGGAAHRVDISRWLGASATTLTGPNAHAYADVNNNDAADAGEEIGPSSGTDWDYPQQSVAPAGGQLCSSFSGICTWDGANLSSELTNRAQATTQVFYYVNTFHDWLAQPDIGFTSGDGNFEGADPVHAEADDGGGTDNANMTTFPDGRSPRMQMYLFKAFPGLPWPAVNGGDDASVVYHEYTHGLSNRLIGGGSGLDANQSGAMGEGWSDWYAMDYLVANGFVSDTSADGEVRVGEYVTDDGVHGIRTQPLDCSVGSSTPACAGPRGGYTYADLGRVGGFDASTPAFEVHDDGEIWSETLWDLRKALGGALARRLITDGMRNSPLDPSMLDERDAILLADQVDDGGANHDSIWQVFAARGMGYGATTTSPNATRGHATFATPQLVEEGGTGLADFAPLGDGDGVPEPGEVLRFAVLLDNPGLVGLTNVHGTLSSLTPGVSVVIPDADFGAIAAGDSGQNASDFALTVDGSVGCGSQVLLRLHVTSDQGSRDVPLVLALGAGDSVFSSTDVPKAIVDDAPTSTNAVSTLTIPSSARVDNLRATVNVTHTFVGDLHVWLTSPAGTTVDLLEQPSSDEHWNGPVTFDDFASGAIQDVPADGATLGGSFVPDEPLAAFAGQDRLGTWRLRVTDNAAGDAGTLNGWSIDTDQPSCSTSSSLPVATTGAATGVTSSGATLGGSVDSGGADTTFVFDYGTTSAYGQRTAEASAGAGSGAAAQSAGIAGLAASTTYHFRIVALRDGIAVATGADQTFATGSSASAAPPPTTTTRPPVPAVAFLTRAVAVNAHNAFAFAFGATPGLRGSVRFTIPKHGRVKAIAFGSRSFTVPSGGRVRLSVKLSRRALAQLRKRHRIKVGVTLVLGGRSFTGTLTLSAPKPRRRHRR
jgi:subtilisin-like proprotein convertase family protein